MGNKTATLYARIEPQLKVEAEEILSELGVSVSSAINMFYRQVVLKGGLPFEVRKTVARPVDTSTLPKADFDALLQAGWDDMQSGRTLPLEQVQQHIDKRFNRIARETA